MGEQRWLKELQNIIKKYDEGKKICRTTVGSNRISTNETKSK